MPSQTRTGVTFGNDTSVGAFGWTNPLEADASDDSYASASNFGGGTSYYLYMQQCSFSIPTGATVTGVEFTVERRASTTPIRDYAVRLRKAGSMTGDNKADTGTNWPGSDGSKTYGGPGDLWGLSLSPSDCNATQFGAGLACDIQTMDPAQAEVDFFSLTIYYDDPPPDYFPAVPPVEQIRSRAAPVTLIVAPIDLTADPTPPAVPEWFAGPATWPTARRARRPAAARVIEPPAAEGDFPGYIPALFEPPPPRIRRRPTDHPAGPPDALDWCAPLLILAAPLPPRIRRRPPGPPLPIWPAITTADPPCSCPGTAAWLGGGSTAVWIGQLEVDQARAVATKTARYIVGTFACGLHVAECICE